MIVCNTCANENKIVAGAPGLSLPTEINYGGITFKVKPVIESPEQKHFCSACLLKALASFDFNKLIKDAQAQEELVSKKQAEISEQLKKV